MVDRAGRGWVHTGAEWVSYDPTAIETTRIETDEGTTLIATLREDGRASVPTLDQLRETAGPLRPVVPVTLEEAEAITRALRDLGHLAIGCLLRAIANVYTPHADDPRFAARSLVAGRPGSWESADLISLIPLALQARDVTRYATPASDRLAVILEAWCHSENRYVEVAETLAWIVAVVADEYKAAGWDEMTDQFVRDAGDEYPVYKLLFSTSQWWDPDR